MFEAHFQTFDEPEGGVALSARLSALREELARRNLTGFVIPRADQQQNEYVAPSEERLAWLTGVTGSAGLAVVLTGEAAVFVDGRYTLQAVECLAACGMAPVLQVNDQFVENVSLADADALLDRLDRGESVPSHPGEWNIVATTGESAHGQRK